MIKRIILIVYQVITRKYYIRKQMFNMIKICYRYDLNLTLFMAVNNSQHHSTLKYNTTYHEDNFFWNEVFRIIFFDDTTLGHVLCLNSL